MNANQKLDHNLQNRTDDDVAMAIPFSDTSVKIHVSNMTVADN
jgi:hypothetical protein